MNSYKPSTKEQPIRFFETFINKKSLSEYEENFYKDCREWINPTQVKNRSQGYIKYQKDFYEKDEAPFVIVYFEKQLKTFLENEANTSHRLLSERKIEKEYDEVFKNDFIDHRISDLDVILERAKNLTYKDLITDILEKLREKMINLRYPKNPTPVEAKRRGSIKSNNPYFGLKEQIKFRHLKKLYRECLIIELISDEEVTEDNFLEVFTSSNPAFQEDKIIFNQDNNHVMALFHFLKPYFTKLTHSRIAKSKSFFSKSGKEPMSQNSLDSSKSRFKSKKLSDYKVIQDAILKAMP